MATLSGFVNYSSVVPSSMGDRFSFDGSFPYGISSTSWMYQGAGDGNSVSTVFVMAGQPADASKNIGDAATLVGLQKPCKVNLTDVFVKGGSGCARYRVQITVCDPSSFPSSDDHVYLYDSMIVPGDGGLVRIPDISGIMVYGSAASPLNVCVKITFTTTLNSSCTLSFHGVCIIDD